MGQLKETRATQIGAHYSKYSFNTNALSSVDKLIQKAMSGQNLRRSAFEYFQTSHPLELATQPEAKVLSQLIEDQGCNQVSLKALLDGLAHTEGELHHYISGLVVANFTVRALMESHVPSEHSGFAVAIQCNRASALESICESNYKLLNQCAADPEMANQLAIFECSTYALVHANPASGGVWLSRLPRRQD